MRTVSFLTHAFRLQKIIGIHRLYNKVYIACVGSCFVCMCSLKSILSAHAAFRCIRLWFDLLIRVFCVKSITCLQTFKNEVYVA